MTEHIERLQRYLDRFEKDSQYGKEHIHGFDVGAPSEAVLRASDIRAVISHVKELESQLESIDAGGVEPLRSAGVPDRDALADLITEQLRGTYYCERVWEAWSYGTMSANDFSPVDESDIPDEIADAIIAKLSADRAQSAQADHLPEAGNMIGTQASQRDALLQVALDFIGTLTGMSPPPIEIAPPEVFAPFYAFVDRVQAITSPAPAPNALDAIGQAIRDYHFALDSRQHGGVAADTALRAIQGAIGMHWQQGAEAERRAAQSAQKNGG